VALRQQRGVEIVERAAAGAGRRVRGIRELPAGQVGVPGVPDLARGDELVERGDLGSKQLVSLSAETLSEQNTNDSMTPLSLAAKRLIELRMSGLSM